MIIFPRVNSYAKKGGYWKKIYHTQKTLPVMLVKATSGFF